MVLKQSLVPGCLLLGGLVWAGCTGGPGRISAPTWDPEAMADQALADLDKDGDGLLSAAELEAAPGLKYCAKQLDAQGDGDGSLSRAEIVARIKQYQEGNVGLTSFSCQVLLDKRPLVGAKVRLVPEPFLGNVVELRQSISKRGGRVEFTVEGINMSVVPVCMYRVEVTSPNVEIPAKYNTQTTLGVEVSAMTDPFHQGPVVFRLKSK